MTEKAEVVKKYDDTFVFAVQVLLSDYYLIIRQCIRENEKRDKE